MNSITILLTGLIGLASAQFFEPFAAQTLSFAIQPPPVQQNSFPAFKPLPIARAQQKPAVVPHRVVVANSENEARLPPELLNNFYKNPRIAQALAKDSWFGPGEEQVVNRETETIPREKILKLLQQAGFARRR